MGDKDIPWEKVQDKPNKNFKVSGSLLIEFRKKIEDQKGKISELDASINELKGIHSKKTKEHAGKIENFEKTLFNLEKAIEEKENQVKLMQEDLESKSRNMNDTIQQLEAREREILDELEAEKQQKMELGSKIADLHGKIKLLNENSFHLEADKSWLTARAITRDLKLERLERENDALIDKIIDKKMGDAGKFEPSVDFEEFHTQVRACMTCKEYVLAKQEYKYQRAVQIFDASHRGHMLGTLTYQEVKQDFSSKTDEFLQRVM